MKMNLLLLVILFCFSVPAVWAETAAAPHKDDHASTVESPPSQCKPPKKVEKKEKCAEKQTSGQSAAPVLSPLSAQVPKGSTLVIVSSKDNTFNAQNEVDFNLSEAKSKEVGKSFTTVKVQSVSCDGRVVCVQVPPKAQSGQIIIKNGASEIGKVAINIVESSKCEGVMKLLMAFSPASFFLIFLLLVAIALKKSRWSLSEALSESEALRNNDGSVVTNANGEPRYPRSASRFIAFIGLFGIITWIMGLSIPALYRFACTGEFPDLNGVSTFLAAQAAIFTPYIANKIASAIK